MFTKIHHYLYDMKLTQINECILSYGQNDSSIDSHCSNHKYNTKIPSYKEFQHLLFVGVY